MQAPEQKYTGLWIATANTTTNPSKPGEKPSATRNYPGFAKT